MGTFQDKAQRPSEQTSTCPTCRGAKCVKDAGGKTVTCPRCRGTGQATKGYITK